MNKGEKGFAQVLVLVLLLAGLAGGAVLVQNNTNLFSKAYLPTISKRLLSQPISSPVSTPTPTPVQPWTAVNLTPPAGSTTPKASGTVTVTLKENNRATGYITVGIEGSFKGLVPNTHYGVWLCSSDGTSCGTNSGNSYPTIKTDRQGSVYFFSGLTIVRREDPKNPNSFIKVYDWGGRGCTVQKPCLIGNYRVPTATPSPISYQFCDANRDRVINGTDGKFVQGCWNKSASGECTKVDTNGDKKIDIRDVQKYSATCPQIFAAGLTPTPTPIRTIKPPAGGPSPTPTSIPPLSLTGKGAFDINIGNYSSPIDGIVLVDQQKRKISITCTLGALNCSFTASYIPRNRTGQNLYYPTVWVDNSTIPYNPNVKMLQYLNNKGQLTSNQSTFTVAGGVIQSNQEALNTYFKVSPPQTVGRYTGTMYIDAKTCNNNVTPSDCIYYGGSSFTVEANVVAPTTSTPTPGNSFFRRVFKR